MHARAVGKLTDVPTTVNARSTNCLASIKSVVQVIYHLQNDNSLLPAICMPSASLDWLDTLEYVTEYMQNQPPTTLATKAYGVWIMLAIEKKYPCE